MSTGENKQYEKYVEIMHMYCAKCEKELFPNSRGAIDEETGDILCGDCWDEHIANRHKEPEYGEDWLKLNEHERTSIEALIVEAGYMNEDVEELRALYFSYITKVEGFVSDGPGFVGDVFLIVFGAGPEFSLVVACYAPNELNESWRIVGYGEEMLPTKEA